MLPSLPSHRPDATPLRTERDLDDGAEREVASRDVRSAPPANTADRASVAFAPAGATLVSRLAVAAAALTLVTATAGLLDQTLYRPSTPEALLPGVASQDLVCVFAALGVLGCVRACRRGARRPWLVAIGLLGYLLYAYAIYAFAGVYNPLFLCYLAILGLSLYAIGAFFVLTDLSASFPIAQRGSFPRRPFAAYLLVLIGLFATLWLVQLLPAMFDRAAPDAGVVFVLDLAIFLPLYAIAASLLWRRSPLGDVLAVPVLVKVGTLGLSVLVGTLLAPLYGHAVQPGEVALYALMGVIPMALLPAVLSALQARPSARRST